MNFSDFGQFFDSPNPQNQQCAKRSHTEAVQCSCSINDNMDVRYGQKKKSDEKIIIAAEIKFMRRMVGEVLRDRARSLDWRLFCSYVLGRKINVSLTGKSGDTIWEKFRKQDY